MKNIEKQLILELFQKLKKIESQTPDKDIEAEKIIYQLLNENNNVTYYMVQTLLVQDILIKELTEKNKHLQSQMCNASNQSNFLSNDIKNNILHNRKKQPIENKRNIFVNHYQSSEPSSFKNHYIDNKNNSNHSSSGGISSFIGNALQTVIGVAGGMVAGNILSDLFNRHKDTDNIENDIKNGHNEDIDDKNVDNSINNNFFHDKISDKNINDHEIESNNDHKMYDMNDPASIDGKSVQNIQEDDIENHDIDDNDIDDNDIDDHDDNELDDCDVDDTETYDMHNMHDLSDEENMPDFDENFV